MSEAHISRWPARRVWVAATLAVAWLATVEAIPLRELQEAQLAETRAGEELQQAEARLAAARGRLQIAGFADDRIDRLETGGSSSITRLVALKAPAGGTIVERHVGV